MSDIKKDKTDFSDIFNRAEKLTSVLYKVTDYIPDSEPIKWSIREDATSVLRTLSYTQFPNNYGNDRPSNEIMGHLNSILSLCEIAKSSDIFSRMNFTILKDEYQNLFYLVQSVGVGLKPMIAFPRFERSSLITRRDQKITVSVVAKPKTANQHQHTSIGQDESGLTSQTEKIARDTSYDIKHRSFENSRQLDIMSFLKDKGETSIKDIRRAISGYGEKTIQRELASLVVMGKLSKRGARRWTTYRLI